MKRKKTASAKSVADAVGFSQMSLGTKIAWLSLLCLVVAVPLAVSYPGMYGLGTLQPWTADQFDLPKVLVMRVFALLGMAGWVSGVLFGGGVIRVHRTMWAALAFLGWTLVSVVFSIHPATSVFGTYGRFEGVLSFLTYATVAFLAVQLIDRPSRIRALVRAFVVSSALVSLYGLIQYLGGDWNTFGGVAFEAGRSFSTYGNPNLLAGLLALALPVTVGLALSEESTAWRWGAWAAAILALAVTVTAFTRSAWVAAPFSLGALAFALWRLKVRPRTEEWALAAAGVVAGGVVVARSLSASTEVMNAAQRLTSTFRFGEGSAETRLQIWSAAVDAVAKRPIQGWGADTFRMVFQRFAPASYVSDGGYLAVTDNAHNYILQIAATLGVVGLLLLYGLFVAVLTMTARLAFSSQGGRARLLYSSVWAACLGYLVHLTFGISVPGTSVFLWLFLGVLISPVATSKVVPDYGRSTAMVGTVLAGAVAAVGIGAVLSQGVADKAYLTAQRATDANVRVAAAARAMRLDPFSERYRRELAFALEAQAEQVLGAAPNDPAARQQSLASLQQAENAYRDLLAFIPDEPENYVFFVNALLNHAQVFADPSVLDEALSVGERGVAVEPTGPAARWVFARALIAAGRSDEAREQLEVAIRLDPSYADAGVLLAQLLAQGGETQKAAEVLKAIEGRTPGQPGVIEGLRALEASGTAP